MFKGIIDLKIAIEDQRKVSEIVNELEKKINSRRGRPLSEENKDEIKNLIENGREILTTRKDIIKAYRKSRAKREPNLIDFNGSDDGNNDGNDDDDDDDDDDNDDGNDDGNNDGNYYNENTKIPDWVGVPRKRFNEIKRKVKKYKNNNLHSKLLKK